MLVQRASVIHAAVSFMHSLFIIACGIVSWHSIFQKSHFIAFTISMPSSHLTYVLHYLIIIFIFGFVLFIYIYML